MDDVQQQRVPPTTSVSIPIDPALAAQWPGYYPYPQVSPPLSAAGHHPPLPHADHIGHAATPTSVAESPQSAIDGGLHQGANVHGKRPVISGSNSSRKKSRTADEHDNDFEDDATPATDKDGKPKTTRGSRCGPLTIADLADHLQSMHGLSETQDEVHRC
jgi:hypothetical protein